MTEEEIMEWVKLKANECVFIDAASLAQEFLELHSITNSLDPDFSKAMELGSKITQKMYDF